MLDLHTPTAKEALDFSTDPEALKAAFSAIRILRELTRAITPQAVATLARQRFPGQPLAMAIASLEVEVAQAHAELVGHTELARAAQDAERERLAPVRSSAVRRAFAAQERLEQINREIPRVGSAAEARRSKLEEAGLSQNEIDCLAPAPDTASLLAEREELTIELGSLNAFIATGDESYLPEGFTVTDPVKVSFPLEKLAA